jgi:hypothetical protein
MFSIFELGLGIWLFSLLSLLFSLVFFSTHVYVDIDYSLSVSTEFGTLYMILNIRWPKSLESVATVPFFKNKGEAFIYKNARCMCYSIYQILG